MEWLEYLARGKIRPRADRTQRAAGDETRGQQVSVEGLRVYVLVQRRGCHALALSITSVRAKDRPTDVACCRIQLDYTAGVMPITRVDCALDKLVLPFFRPRNKIECNEYKCYDADNMHGLPVGVQIVWRRLEGED